MSTTIAQPQVRFGGSLGPLLGQIDKLQGRLDGFANKTQGIGAKILDVGAKFGGLTLAIGAVSNAVQKAIAPLASGFELANQLEQDQIAFETMLKSADAAAQHIEALKQFAATTPFRLPGLISTSKQLLAFGFTADEQIPLLTKLGDVAAGTGSQVDDLGRIYGQIGAEGKLTAERFNQLVERGVPIGPALAESMGIAESSLRDAMRSGQITADVFQDAFASMAETNFEGLMDKQSGTIAGRLSTLMDDMSNARATFVGDVMEGINFGGILERLTSTLDKLKPILARAAARVAGVMNVVMERVTGVLKSIGAFAMLWLTKLYQFGEQRIESIGQSVYHRFNAMWELLKGIGSAVMTLLTNLWDATLGLWLGSVDELTASTEGGGNKITAALAWIADGWQWLQDKITAAVYRVSYTLQNLRAAFEIVGTAVAHAVVKIGNQVKQIFTVVVPDLLGWFGRNWDKVLTDVANLTFTIFKNIGSNIVDVFTNLPGLISGSTDWSDVWTPLTEGFEMTLEELPTIAEREIGGMEAQLALDLAAQRQAFGEGFEEFMEKQRKGVNDLMNQLGGSGDEGENAGDNDGKEGTEAPKMPELPAMKMPELPDPTPAPEPVVAAVEPVVAAASSLPKLTDAFSAENLARTFGEGIELGTGEADVGAEVDPIQRTIDTIAETLKGVPDVLTRGLDAITFGRFDLAAEDVGNVAVDAADAAATAPQDHREEVNWLKRLARKTDDLVDVARREERRPATVFTIPV
ncbi:MAG: tape measure protein [Planctomycetota bacterium]